MNNFLPLLAGLTAFAALDYIWLTVIAKQFYLSQLASHVSIKDGGLVPYLPAVPLVYIVALVGIWFFVLKQSATIRETFRYGALLGFILYAFYDLTNLATLKEYSWWLTLVDIAWGTLAVAIVSASIFYLKTFF